MKYLPYIALTLLAAAAGLFIWSRKASREGMLGPASQQKPVNTVNTGDSPPDLTTSNSFISQSGTCPQGYRTSYQSLNCFVAPCPAQTICTKDAILSAMGGFLGNHNFPLN